MKTPLEIASRAVFDSYPGVADENSSAEEALDTQIADLALNGDGILAIMQTAIENDRAQRDDPETVTVSWVTTITESHTAQIPALEFERIQSSGTIADALADYEHDETLTSVAVIDRTLEEDL